MHRNKFIMLASQVKKLKFINQNILRQIAFKKDLTIIFRFFHEIAGLRVFELSQTL